MYTSGDSYTQSINVNMLPGYMQLADIPSLYVSQYDMGLYKYKINLYEKNSPYDIDHWLNPEPPETDEIITGEGEPNGDPSDDGGESSGDDIPSGEGDESDEDEKTSAVYVQGIKSDGKIFRYECEYKGNTVTLPEKEQITNVAGRVKCEIVIVNNESRKTSAVFYIEVEASLIQDAYKVSEDDVEKLVNEKEAEPTPDPSPDPQPDDGSDIGDDNNDPENGNEGNNDENTSGDTEP